MKIVILGGGQVGSSVAANLVSEANDITVIDNNPQVLKNLKEHYDLSTVLGMACHPPILEEAGMRDADMMLAVTDSDEVNMAACQIANILFHTPTKIARIRSPEYLQKESGLFAENGLAIDVHISPEQTATENIAQLIDYPGALQVMNFAHGQCQMVAVRIPRNSPVAGYKIHQLVNYLPTIDYRIPVIFRQDRAIIPNGQTILEKDDDIFFLGSRKNMRHLLQKIAGENHRSKRIMIAGGGNIGMRLAEILENNYRVQLIELNAKRAQLVSEQLDKSIVIDGDATDENLLSEENIQKVDVFCALTNADEANIISSILAKKMGAHKVICLVNRTAYANLVEKEIIDIAISPQQTTIGSILTHVRRGDVVMVHALRGGAAEAIEAIAHGDENASHVVGKKIEDLALPPGTSIGAIIRNGQVIIAHHDSIIATDDHIIFMVTNKKSVPAVESLFQVKATFL